MPPIETALEPNNANVWQAHLPDNVVLALSPNQPHASAPNRHVREPQPCHPAVEEEGEVPSHALKSRPISSCNSRMSSA